MLKTVPESVSRGGSLDLAAPVVRWGRPLPPPPRCRRPRACCSWRHAGWRGRSAGCQPAAGLQELPQLEKQAKWSGKPSPGDNGWDATIKEAVERGKEVPEISWAEPGEAAAGKVRRLGCSAWRPPHASVLSTGGKHAH